MEKVHSNTFSWSVRVNTPTKDLVDLVLLIERSLPVEAAIRSALRATFAARATHPLPASLDPPPASWAVDFPAMAAEAGLSKASGWGPHAGRLVIPCDHREPVDGKPVMFSHVFFSDDHGRTWSLGGTVDRHTDECQVVELATASS